MASGPRYSWIRVKVGLVTSSSEAAWKASAMPLTSVVLPAPRSPRSTTIFGGVSIVASVRPRAIVSSGDWVMNSRVSMRFLETSITTVQRLAGDGVQEGSSRCSTGKRRNWTSPGQQENGRRYLTKFRRLSFRAQRGIPTTAANSEQGCFDFAQHDIALRGGS